MKKMTEKDHNVYEFNKKYIEAYMNNEITKEEMEAKIDSINNVSSQEEKYLLEINKSEEREKKAFALLPNWDFKLSPNSLCLLGAVSGGGKTTLTIQFILNVLSQSKSVCFIGNEERASNIFRSLKTYQDRFEVNVSELMRNQRLLIIDVEKCPQVEYYDKVVSDVIAPASEKFDFVLFDQLNYCTLSSQGKEIEPFKSLKSIASQLKNVINAGNDKGAIMITQQINSPGLDRNGGVNPATWEMMHLLRDCKSTIRPCTHALMYHHSKGTGTGYLKVDKQRQSVSLRCQKTLLELMLIDGLLMEKTGLSLENPWKV